MTTRAFFSFHYERDFWKVSEIKSHWVSKPERESAGLIEEDAWASLKLQGDAEIKQWIRNQLHRTSVTVVMIGTETHSIDYVNYEISLSHERKNGLLGVYIHNIQDVYDKRDLKGKNPFDNFRDISSGLLFSQIYPTYDWTEDDGYTNFEKWIETAAALAGK
jgi:hypothetical protein